MRLLIASLHEPWPLNGGGRLHLYHVLDQLGRRADVTLVLPVAAEHRECLPRGLRVEVTATGVGPDGLAAATLPRGPWLSRLAARHFGYDAGLAAWLHQHARPARFDAVLLHGAVLGQYAHLCHVPVVWDPVDELVLHAVRKAQFGRWYRWPAALRHAVLYALYERNVARRAAVTTLVSSVDAAYARRWVGDAAIAVITHGVDLDYFRPTDTSAEPGTVAFVGSLEFPPNVDGIRWFASQVWPELWQSGAARRLLVVGRRPVADVRALTAQPGVELAADVPDVRPYLTRAAVVVVPTRQGGGVKNKVLEACAMRRPVVASPRALGGLSARVGVDVLAAETPRQWLAQLTRLLTDPDEAATIAEGGYRWVQRAHRWATTGGRLYALLSRAAAPAPRDRPTPLDEPLAMPRRGARGTP